MKLPPIPDRVRWLLSRLPQYPASAAFAAALTLGLGATLGRASLFALTDHVLRLITLRG